jgi:hypothetical protein
MMRQLRWSAVLLTVGTALLAVRPSAQQGGDTETLSVNDSRPLNEATTVVEERCRCRITYEDPAFGKDDVVDVSKEYPQARVPVFSPRGGMFIFTTQLARGDHGMNDVAAALRDIVDTYNLTGYPGRFHVNQTGAVVHVEPEHSVLDTRVTAHFNKVSADSVTHALLASIEKAGGPHLQTGPYGFRQLVSIDADDRPARDVFADLIVQLTVPTSRMENGRSVSYDKPVTWHLLRDAYSGEYVFNLVPVP